MSDKILITGADGFIGSHLTEFLVKKGLNVKALCYYNSFNSLGWIDTFEKNIINNIEIISGDVRDYTCIKKATKNVDVIMHLAALIAIPYSYYAPLSYVQTNVHGTLNILEAAKDNDVGRTLITSTSEVYGTAKYTPIDENHPLQGQSPYSASKIAADKLAESYFRSYDLPVTIVRPFNTFGPRQSARAVIPTIITQLLSGEEQVKLGSVCPRRDLNYVLDICNGFLKIMLSEKTNGYEINIATGKDFSIKEIADKLINMINPEAQIVCDEKRIRPEKSEVLLLNGCNKRIKKLTDWKPHYILDDALKENVSWFEKNLNKYKSGIYNV